MIKSLRFRRGRTYSNSRIAGNVCLDVSSSGAYSTAFGSAERSVGYHVPYGSSVPIGVISRHHEPTSFIFSGIISRHDRLTRIDVRTFIVPLAPIEARGVGELVEVLGQQVDRIRGVLWVRRSAMASNIARDSGVRVARRLQQLVCCRVIGQCTTDEDDGWAASSKTVAGFNIVDPNRGQIAIYRLWSEYIDSGRNKL